MTEAIKEGVCQLGTQYRGYDECILGSIIALGIMPGRHYSAPGLQPDPRGSTVGAAGLVSVFPHTRELVC